MIDYISVLRRIGNISVTYGTTYSGHENLTSTLVMINTEQLSEYVTGSNIWVNVLVYILRTCVVTDTNLCTLVSVKE